jgi:hypothetical protein
MSLHMFVSLRAQHLATSERKGVKQKDSCYHYNISTATYSGNLSKLPLE